jgi:gluconolactonase
MRIYAFPLGTDGLVSGARKILVDFKDQAGCDGMTVDSKGHVYLSVRNLKRPGIMAIDPAGKEVAFIPTGMPNQDPDKPAVGIPSNVTFGIGPDKSMLYITIDLELYRIPLKAEGYVVGAK